mmetsp:Transcript_21365/g.43359  ORF Transcript_21365/g.43359 Transcript_21365/m.43359 type:complete len:205 (+) Transcript_21365:90-704(+)
MQASLENEETRMKLDQFLRCCSPSRGLVRTYVKTLSTIEMVLRMAIFNALIHESPNPSLTCAVPDAFHKVIPIGFLAIFVLFGSTIGTISFFFFFFVFIHYFFSRVSFIGASTRFANSLAKLLELSVPIDTITVFVDFVRRLDHSDFLVKSHGRQIIKAMILVGTTIITPYNLSGRTILQSLLIPRLQRLPELPPVVQGPSMSR